VRVRTASYAVPEGFSIAVTHVGGCDNGSRDEELVRCVRGADPKIISEMVAAARAVMTMMGCPPGCHVCKEGSGGILFQDHSQDSSFVASSGSSAGQSTGTGSLVGERLIEGVQGTPTGEQALNVGCLSQFTSSWPSGLSGLPSSEKVMYKGMQLDRASDADYVPSSVVVDDVAMSLGDNKTSERNGLGDSRHASAGGSCDKVDSLASTVPYSVSATQDILGALAEYEAGTIALRPAELDSCDGSLDFMDDVEQSAQVVPDVGEVLSDHERVVRLEKGIEEDRELFDRLLDIVEDLEVSIGDLVQWKNNVIDNGCSRCSVDGQHRSSTKASVPRPAIPRQASVAKAGPSTESVPVAKFPGGQVKSNPIHRAANGDRKGSKNVAVANVAVATAPTPAPAPTPPVTILRRPAYMSTDEDRAVKSFATVAASNASVDGYSIVKGRKRFPAKLQRSPDPITSIPVKARHLTLRFERARDEKMALPAGVTVSKIRDSLNTTLFSLNCQAYFSLAVLGKWGDVLLTLAATDVTDIIGYFPAMREALSAFNLAKFTFARDTPKVKVFVGTVPLSRFGGSWQPSEWEGRSAFDHLAADIEQSNPGVVIAARPSWAGRIHKLKERKVNNAGLILVLELTPEVKRMMAVGNPRLVVCGRPRPCRLWREDSPAVVCNKCCMVGHRTGECRNKPVCAFCHKEHMTSRHECPVMSCRKVGTACSHVRRVCILCHSGEHFAGHRDCVALRGSSSSPPVVGPSTPVVADHTSVVGVSDRSRGRLRRQAAGRPGSTLAEHMVDNGVSGVNISEVKLRSELNPDRAIHNREVVLPRLEKGKGVARSPSAPADVSRAGGSGILSAW